jgi:hypothetical protein
MLRLSSAEFEMAKDSRIAVARVIAGRGIGALRGHYTIRSNSPQQPRSFVAL